MDPETWAVSVGVCYRLSIQEDGMDEALYIQMGGISHLQALVPLGISTAAFIIYWREAAC